MSNFSLISSITFIIAYCKCVQYDRMSLSRLIIQIQNNRGFGRSTTFHNFYKSNTMEERSKVISKIIENLLEFMPECRIASHESVKPQLYVVVIRLPVDMINVHMSSVKTAFRHRTEKGETNGVVCVTQSMNVFCTKM